MQVEWICFRFFGQSERTILDGFVAASHRAGVDVLKQVFVDRRSRPDNR